MFTTTPSTLLNTKIFKENNGKHFIPGFLTNGLFWIGQRSDCGFVRLESKNKTNEFWARGNRENCVADKICGDAVRSATPIVLLSSFYDPLGWGHRYVRCRVRDSRGDCHQRHLSWPTKNSLGVGDQRKFSGEGRGYVRSDEFLFCSYLLLTPKECLANTRNSVENFEWINELVHAVDNKRIFKPTNIYK